MSAREFPAKYGRRAVISAGLLTGLAIAVRSGSRHTLANETQPGPGGSSRSPLQDRVDAAAKAGGGTILLPARATTTSDVGLILRDGVTLDLNGGTLVLTLSEGDETGVRLRSNTTLQNGTIIVRSRGTPGTQGGIHAPVVVGALLGERNDPSRLSPNEGVSGWKIRNLRLSGNKNVRLDDGQYVGAPAIQIMGGAHHGLIEDITIPDDGFTMGGVHLDWGVVGSMSSSTIQDNARAFAAGRAWTTHPHDITIRRIRVGRLHRKRTSAGGTFGVRLSGVHDVSVQDVQIQSVTEAGFYHTAGDMGFEFAQPSSRNRRCLGIRVSDGVLRDASTAYVVWSNSHADNVSRAAGQGYVPRIDPIHTTDIVFERITGVAGNPSIANFGFRVDHQRGGTLVDCSAEGFKRGFYVDEQVDSLDVIRPVAIDSIEAGISVEHPHRPPRRIKVVEPEVRAIRRGTSPRSCGVLIGRSSDVELVGSARLGTGEQQCGLRITDQARGARVTR